MWTSSCICRHQRNSKLELDFVLEMQTRFIFLIEGSIEKDQLFRSGSKMSGNIDYTSMKVNHLLFLLSRK